MNPILCFTFLRRPVAPLLCLMAVALAVSINAQPVLPTSVLYSDDWTDPRYSTLRGILDEVYGDDDPDSGVFTETEAQYFQVAGQGPQDVEFTFLYDGGGYEFEFGFFHITNDLLALPTNTVAEKQAWALQALTGAQIVIVDAESSVVPTGSIRATEGPPIYANEDRDWEYDGLRSSVNTNTVTLTGGSRIGFFIIPDNTLANFLANWSTGFDINGSNVENDGRNWPLFSINDANPGLQTGNTGAAGNPANGVDEGTNPDQVLTFDGETQPGWLGAGSQPKTGTLVSFEDLWRRPNPGSGWWNSSDSDFEDLVFFVGNVASVPVPEPATVISGLLLGLFVGCHAWQRRRKNKSQTPAGC
jgi:hypothetical protein